MTRIVACLLFAASCSNQDSGGGASAAGRGGEGGHRNGNGGETARGGGTAGDGGKGGGTPAGPPRVFAVIGDYGYDYYTGIPEKRVSKLVASWAPDHVITLGDNNYPDGEASTIDDNIGQYYSAFIGDYTGEYGPGSSSHRFWPSLGNHDWETGSVKPYTDYFTLPGNERYYEVRLGDVGLFVVDSDPHEPDGVSATSKQGKWLQAALAASDACLKLVAFHHPPFSTGEHGNNAWMNWPFKAWGAHAVLSGHDHIYERFDVEGFPYFVNGLGGGYKYEFFSESENSVVRYNKRYGAMRVTLSDAAATMEFIDIFDEVQDTLVMPLTCLSAG